MTGSSLEAAFDGARRTPWWASFDAAVRSAEQRADAPPEWRAALQRVRGREAEWLRENIPLVGEPWRRPFESGIAALDDDSALLLLACIHAMAGYRPHLIAAELIRGADDDLESKMRRDALSMLWPPTFLRAHVGAEAAALAASVLGARPEPAGLADVVNAAEALSHETSRLPAAAVAALEAHARLLEAPTMFDYGCGAGALMSAFARDFEVSGGDLFAGSSLALMSPMIAELRLRIARGPDAASASDVRSRVLVLDESPRHDSPPPGLFSVVTSNGVMEHVHDPATFRAVMRHMLARLRPGGVLLVNCTPTLLGVDGHHLMNAWWGVALHRSRWLRETFFAGRWREGFTTPVPRRALTRSIEDVSVGPVGLYPNSARVAARLGHLAPVALPIGRALARMGCVPVHYLGWWRVAGAADGHLRRRRVGPAPHVPERTLRGRTS